METRHARFNTALVCENGHLVTPCLEQEPEYQEQAGCKLCGARLISFCPSCNKRIDGCRSVETISTFKQATSYNPISKGKQYEIIQGPPKVTHELDSYSVPFHCQHCRAAFPWTAATMAEINEIISMADELDEVDRTLLIEKFPVILLPDIPGKTAAALRISKILSIASTQTVTALKAATISKLSGEVLKFIGWK